MRGGGREHAESLVEASRIDRRAIAALKLRANDLERQTEGDRWSRSEATFIMKRV